MRQRATGAPKLRRFRSTEEVRVRRESAALKVDRIATLFCSLPRLRYALRIGQHIGSLCPGVPFGQQIGGAVGLLRGQIVQFRAIGFEVVKFPVAVAPMRTNFQSPTRTAALPSCSQ